MTFYGRRRTFEIRPEAKVSTELLVHKHTHLHQGHPKEMDETLKIDHDQLGRTQNPLNLY